MRRLPIVRRWRRLVAAARPLAVLGLAAAAWPAAAQLVADPGRLAAGVRYATDGVSFSPVDRDGFVITRFEPVATPTVTFAPADGAWDWRGATALKLHVQNAMPWAVTLRIELRDAAGGVLRTEVGLPPGPPQTLAMPVMPASPRDFGLLAAPPMPWLRADPGGAGAERMFVATDVRGRVDPARLAAVALTVPGPDSPQLLRVGKLFLEPRDGGRDDLRDAYTGIVDGFGQAARGTWPQKVATLQALQAAGAEEDARLAGVEPVPPAIDRAPRRATGFFRVERLPRAGGGDRWWLVDPDGRPFFSIGVNCVRPGDDDTLVEGREFMFVDLPPQADDPRFLRQRDAAAVLSPDSAALRGRAHARGRSVDFHRLNLWRRDGDGFEARWRDRTRRRLAAWGFNTVANWSDDRFDRDGPWPFVKAVAVGGEFATISDGVDLWGRAPDPFDPRFAIAVRRAVDAASRDLRTERRLIGYFVDNEVAWGDGASGDPARRYALAMHVLRQDASSSPAKRAFVDALKRRHIDSRRLAALWGVPVTSWAALSAPFEPPPPERPQVADDYAMFLALHADAYFSTIQHELKLADPNHLFLGSRFGARTPEAVAACARWCDVVSFNLYVPSIATGFDGEAFRRLGRPAMLTEFHFGATDRGPFGAGVIAVPRSADRGRAYRALLESVIDNPDFVGAHWFQYVDEPASGRWLDGENAHVGLVAITDLPWADFVGEVADANRAALRRLAAD